MARKRVYSIRNQNGYRQGGMFANHNNPSPGMDNYENPDVIQIREQLGDFDYDKEPQNLGRREERQMVILENGAKYEGQWLLNSNIRQGQGT
jgi:hypothetical protein